MITVGPSILARACPVSAANALGITLTAPPHASQVVIIKSPKTPTFGQNPFQVLILKASPFGVPVVAEPGKSPVF